jgi:hypothetical protein
MIPIGMITCISVRNTVTKEINHLDNQTKQSLK